MALLRLGGERRRGRPGLRASADQFAARHIGQDTRIPSLELCTALRGAQVAWRTPKQSLPQEGNPRAVFYKLFGQGDTDAERKAILNETGSLLDRVTDEVQTLDASLGGADRAAVDDYLGSVREIERRVQMASTADTSALEIPDAPIGVPNDIVEHMKLMFDLMGLAFQADLTRVITLSLDKEASMRSYQNLGISEAFHPLSHHGNIADKQEKLTTIQSFHTKMFAGFIDRLATREGRRRHRARSLHDRVRQQHERQQPAQQRSAADRDPRASPWPNQGWAALALPAGLALRRSAW